MKNMKRILASLLALTALLTVAATGAQADLTGPPPGKPGK
jgi:predicted small lipoprotein YifL